MGISGSLPSALFRVLDPFVPAWESSSMREADRSGKRLFREINCFSTLDTASPRTSHHFIVNEDSVRMSALQSALFCTLGDGRKVGQGLLDCVEFARHRRHKVPLVYCCPLLNRAEEPRSSSRCSQCLSQSAHCA